MNDPKTIFVSTTGDIPHFAGSCKPESSQFIYVEGNYSSIDAAYNELRRRAAKEDFDAVVGVQLEAYTASAYAGGVGSEFNARWSIYGTALRWAK